MALFSNKDTTKKATPKKAETTEAQSQMRVSNAHILQRPRVTEKSTGAALSSVYVFDVATIATKRDIMKAVVALYKVTPTKVAIVTVPTKKVRNSRSGVQGKKGGGKKAYVYLKKGETISIA